MTNVPTPLGATPPTVIHSDEIGAGRSMPGTCGVHGGSDTLKPPTLSRYILRNGSMDSRSVLRPPIKARSIRIPKPREARS